MIRPSRATSVLWYAYDLALKQVWPIGGTAMAVICPIWESVPCCRMCIGLALLPLVKFALVTLVAMPGTFLFSYGVRKLLNL